MTVRACRGSEAEGVIGACPYFTQYYSESLIPKEIIVLKKISKSIYSFLERKKDKKVKITKPQKGEKKQLLDLV
jgi:excinuclease ABC subunit C